MGISPFPSPSLRTRHFRQTAACELGTHFARHASLLPVVRETSADPTALMKVQLNDVTDCVKFWFYFLSRVLYFNGNFTFAVLRFFFFLNKLLTFVETSFLEYVHRNANSVDRGIS